jgi:hypothetical protein
MKAGDISIQELKGYAKSINGTTLETRAQHKRFHFMVDDKGFHYIPESTNKPRIQPNKFVDRVLQRFNGKRSLSPRDYQDLSKNSSYLLAIIEKYLNS